jgi:hypothetical protein
MIKSPLASTRIGMVNIDIYISTSSSVQYDDISFSPVLVAHLASHRLRKHGTSRTSLKEIAAKRIYLGEVFLCPVPLLFLAIAQG